MMLDRARWSAEGEGGPGSGGERFGKQEQEPASEDVIDVAPGVLRMQLPLHFTGLGHVNMYGLVDRAGLAVVDPGMPGRGAWRSVVRALRRAGYRPADVHTVVVTHSHPDHFGGAGRLAAESGAAVVAFGGFAVPWVVHSGPDVVSVDDSSLGTVSLGTVTTEAVVHGPGRLSVPWRAADNAMSPPQLPRSLRGPLLQLAWRMGRRYLEPPPLGRALTDGDQLRLADRDWFVVHTPGHTADHVCLYDPEHRLMIAGDHVLPTITPHVSGIGCGPDPLRQYLDALDRVTRFDVDLVLPAHGHPFADLAGRTDQIVRHHQRRLGRLREIAASEGPATVEVFTRSLFGAGRGGLLAESEVFAHLEHLRHDGAAVVRRQDGALVYALPEGAVPGGRSGPAN
ncbi:MAG: MBL fold metallo-hydrolase [Actinomycetota bacterium]|jgi:glyoxylase-like metal-dependent hydrolase (beta-lactamase superfamily II)|nr:MBL fold metallo-hydrolase [Actinomycetota bacterium]